jgi:hypothetical protein
MPRQTTQFHPRAADRGGWEFGMSNHPVLPRRRFAAAIATAAAIGLAGFGSAPARAQQPQRVTAIPDE